MTKISDMMTDFPAWLDCYLADKSIDVHSTIVARDPDRPEIEVAMCLEILVDMLKTAPEQIQKEVRDIARTIDTVKGGDRRWVLEFLAFLAVTLTMHALEDRMAPKTPKSDKPTNGGTGTVH